MKVEFNKGECLVISVDNNTESMALKRWLENNSVTIKDSKFITLDKLIVDMNVYKGKGK